MRRSGNRGAIPPAVSPGCQGKRPSQTQPDHPETNPDSHRAAAIDGPGEVFRAIAQNAEGLPETAGWGLPHRPEARRRRHPGAGHLSSEGCLREDGMAAAVGFRKGPEPSATWSVRLCFISHSNSRKADRTSCLRRVVRLPPRGRRRVSSRRQPRRRVSWSALGATRRSVQRPDR